jgi:hypothetical protein
MVHLVSVDHTFHARVIAARLGSDGILTELRGALDGPYPGLGEVRVYVDAADLSVARELLLADQVESAFDHDTEGDGPWRPAPAVAWFAAASAVALTTTWMARLL